MCDLAVQPRCSAVATLDTAQSKAEFKSAKVIRDHGRGPLSCPPVYQSDTLLLLDSVLPPLSFLVLLDLTSGNSSAPLFGNYSIYRLPVRSISLFADFAVNLFLSRSVLAAPAIKRPFEIIHSSYKDRPGLTL